MRQEMGGVTGMADTSQPTSGPGEPPQLWQAGIYGPHGAARTRDAARRSLAFIRANGGPAVELARDPAVDAAAGQWLVEVKAGSREARKLARDRYLYWCDDLDRPTHQIEIEGE